MKFERQVSSRTMRCTTDIPGYEPFTFMGYEIFKDYYPSAEMQTKRWILRNLPTDGVFLDVGANVGILTATAALRAKDGIVISMEPTDTIKLLEANIAKLKTQGLNIRTLNVGAANFTGRREEVLYKIWGEKPVNNFYDFRTIDDVVSDLKLTKLDVIKIDTDGWEFEALKGAIRTIERFRPKLIIEINEALATRNVSQQQIMHYLIDLKYTSAQILDGGNFVFSSSWERGMEWPNSISVSTDREAINFTNRGEELLKFEYTKNFQAVDHVDGVEVDSKLVFSGSLKQWAYAVHFHVKTVTTLPSNLIITILGESFEGEVGFAATSDDCSQFVSDEVVVDRPGKFEVSITSFDFQDRFVMRSVSNSQFRLRIDEVFIYSCGPSSFQSEPNLISIPIVHANQFFDALKIDYCIESLPQLFHSESGYLMEQTTAHLLKAFYRTFKPTRHLEIGTWEGFGSQLALSNGAQEVWSVEKYDDLNPEYGSRYHSSAQSVRPGWLVSDRNKSNFHQIFGTSSVLMEKGFKPGFFDSILIDGGHDFESVLRDTEFVLQITQSGNVVFWDDYPIYASDNNSTRDGVLKVVKELSTELDSAFKLFAIRGTALLVGIRR